MTENQNLYNASIKALIDNGVPEELAQKTSEIVAKDDPREPNLGRTEEDQEVVNEAMRHFWAHQKR